MAIYNPQLPALVRSYFNLPATANCISIRYDSVTLNKLIQIDLARARDIKSFSTVHPDGRTNYTTPSDNMHWAWNANTSTWILVSATTGKWIASLISEDIPPTPTPTNTTTITITPSITPTLTPTITETPTPTPTTSETQTPTPTISETPTLTPTNSETPTNTPTTSPTSSETPTSTPTATPTPTITESLTPTPTIGVSVTPTPTNTCTPTLTPSITITKTQTPSPTITKTQTLSPTVTKTQTTTPTTTATITPTATNTATPTFTPTNTPTLSMNCLDPSVSPSSLNFIGQKTYQIIFKTTRSNCDSHCANKITVEIILHNLDKNIDTYYSFVVPDDSQSCCDGCEDNTNFKSIKEFYTTFIFDDLIIGDEYSLRAKAYTVLPTPTPTSSATPTISVSPTNTPTNTPTISITASNTPTNTPTISITPSNSLTPTPTTTINPSVTPTISHTPTPTPSQTVPICLQDFRLLYNNKPFKIIVGSSDGEKLVGFESIASRSALSPNIWQEYAGLPYYSIDSGKTWSVGDTYALTDSISIDPDTNLPYTYSKSFWYNAAISDDGLKVAVVARNWRRSDGYPQSRSVYFSNNGGVSWRSILNGDQGTDVCMSSDGSKIFYVSDLINEFLPNGTKILSSYDEGNNWVELNNSPTKQWTSIACSSDANTIVAGTRGNARNFADNTDNIYPEIYFSKNGGNSWTKASIPPLDYVRSIIDIDVSSDGNTMIAISENQAFISTDNSLWTIIPGTYVLNSQPFQQYTSCSISDDGKTIIITSNTGELIKRFAPFGIYDGSPNGSIPSSRFTDTFICGNTKIITSIVSETIKAGYYSCIVPPPTPTPTTSATPAPTTTPTVTPTPASYCWCEDSVGNYLYDTETNSLGLCSPYKDHVSEEDVPNRSIWRYISTSPTTGYQPIYNPFDPLETGEEGTEQQKTDWLDVPSPGNIKIYMYYTQCLTNVWLPGLGWHRSMGAGGHRCDNAEYNVYIRVGNRWFLAGEVNFNNLEPDNESNSFIQNKSPFDKIAMLNFSIDNEYFDALLRGVKICGKSGPVSNKISSALRLVATNGTAHAIPLTIHIVLGDKYNTWHYSRGYSPTCPDIANPFPNDDTDDDELINNASYVPNGVGDTNTVRLLPYSLCDEDYLYTTNPPQPPSVFATDFTNSTIAGEIGLSITDNPAGDKHISNQNCSPALTTTRLFYIGLRNFPNMPDSNNSDEQKLIEFIRDVFSDNYEVIVTQYPDGYGVGNVQISLDAPDGIDGFKQAWGDFAFNISLATNFDNITIANFNLISVNANNSAIAVDSNSSTIGGWASYLVPNQNKGSFDAVILCVGPDV